jgi:hypothetical protein
LRVDLVGGEWSTRDAYGSWVTCVSQAAGRQSHYVTGNAWRGANTMIDPYFGLGSDATVDTLLVQWPTGAMSVLTDVPAGNVTVSEPDPVFAPEPHGGRAALALAVGPNPTRRSTRFVFAGRTEDRLTIEIFDASGRSVRREAVGPGATAFLWDGVDARGRRVAAGVYFVRAREGDRTAEAKVVLLR